MRHDTTNGLTSDALATCPRRRPADVRYLKNGAATATGLPGWLTGARGRVGLASDLTGRASVFGPSGSLPHPVVAMTGTRSAAVERR